MPSSLLNQTMEISLYTTGAVPDQTHISGKKAEKWDILAVLRERHIRTRSYCCHCHLAVSCALLTGLHVSSHLGAPSFLFMPW